MYKHRWDIITVTFVLCKINIKYRGVAQLVERVVWDHQAAGSNPVTRTISSVHNRFELWTLAFLFSAQPNIAVGYMRYMGPAIIYYIAKWLLPAGYFGGWEYAYTERRNFKSSGIAGAFGVSAVKSGKALWIWLCEYYCRCAYRTCWEAGAAWKAEKQLLLSLLLLKRCHKQSKICSNLLPSKFIFH